MPLDYARFVRAQDPVWTNVLAELRLGRKQTHWMWFVFPQLRGLGRSEMAQFFGLDGVEDAMDYVAHPILCERLETACALLLDHRERAAEEVFGPTDAMKLRSSMTLFRATPAMSDCAQEILDTFFGGEACDITQERISATAPTG